MERRDFFVSYNKDNKAWAEWVVRVLNDNGYSAYMQEQDIKPGESFLTKMNDFLENSANFIAVWSDSYSKSGYCMMEWEAAIKARHEGRMGCVLPVLIDDCPMKALYSALVHVDLSNMDTASEAKLIDKVRHAVSHSERKPSQLERNDKSSKPIRLENGFHYYNLPETLFIDFCQCVLIFIIFLTVGLLTEQTFTARGLLILALLHVLLFAYLFLSGEPDKFLGDYYYHQGNYHQAFQCYRQAVGKKERPDALIKLGSLYQEGLGVEQDYAEARKRYNQAAEKGSGEAKYKLGILYEEGLGVEADYDKARHFYAQALESYLKVEHPDEKKVSELRARLNRLRRF